MWTDDACFGRESHTRALLEPGQLTRAAETEMSALGNGAVEMQTECSCPAR